MRTSRSRVAPGIKTANRKSTRLNSSHLGISYAVFCLKKKNKGISSVMRRDLERVAESPSARPAGTLYGISDGLETTQMHGGTQPAGCLAASGEVWFPSNKGPVRITPGHGTVGNPPAAVIERIVADGRTLPTNGKLELPPGDGKLEIQYSAIRLRSQERMRFRYKLEGFDSEWTEAFGRRLAFYTNLPPGHYRFRVAAYEM